MSVETPVDPHAEYQRRLQRRRERMVRLQTADRRLSAVRGIVFLGAVGLAWGVFGPASLSLWWFAVPLVTFVLLVVRHNQVADRLIRATKAVAYYQQATERLNDQWTGAGATGERYTDASHPYTADLDVFGCGSLFQLISRARTRIGEDRLAGWLSAPVGVATIRGRQQAIDELRGELDLREELALLPGEVHEGVDQNRLQAWSGEPPHLVPLRQRLGAVVLAIAAIVTGLGWLAGLTSLSAFLIVVMVELVLTGLGARRLLAVARTADEAACGLRILANVLEVMEGETFTCELLHGIRARLDTGGRLPSRQIARLQNLIGYLNNCLQNQFFAPIGFLLCLPVHLIHAVETWRSEVGPHVPEWLQSTGEFEALSSLAGYAFEHPDDPFPEIVESGLCYVARGLGHPLLPIADCVRNDIALGDTHRLVLISGSNMSGKSTLLRAVGTNAVLGFVGAPVRATSLQLAPVQLGTAMRVNDSLQDGRSSFSAAVGRLKRVVDLAGGNPPLLFLLDEILQGTNSHDRRVGAEAVIRGLIDAGAFGLVTTHDLALTKIAETLGPTAVNVHFEDNLRGGKMTFDYRMKPGVITHSNALELMRMMGLEVENLVQKRGT